MQTMKNVSFTSPYDQEAEAIRRRQMLAMQLEQQSQAELPAGQMAGGYYVATSPLKYLAQALKGAQARTDIARGDTELRELSERAANERSGALSAALRTMQGTPASSEQIVDEQAAGGMGAPATINAPAVPGNMQAGIQQLAGSRDPMLQQIGLQQVLAQMQREQAEPQRVDLGDKIGLMKNGQIVGYLPKGVTPDASFKEVGLQRRHETPSGSTLLTHNTPSAGQLLTDERTRAEGVMNRGVTMRGQNMTDARARETLESGRWVNDTARGIQINSATGETRPITQAGVPIGPKDDAPEAQLKAAGYADRMRKAAAILDAQSASGKPGLIEAGLATKAPTAANLTRSPERQQYYQAAEDWVRAKLRQESGAVIADEEMAREIRTYFPMIGDSPEVVRQKAQARATAEQAMVTAAGKARSQVPGATGGGKPPRVVDW